MAIYTDYTAEDFAEDDYFRQWVQQPVPESDHFWNDFLAAHPEKKPVIEAAQALLKAIEYIQVVPTSEQGQRMWATIDRRTQHETVFTNTSQPTPIRIGWRWAWAAAAAVVFLIGVGWWLYVKPKSPALATIDSRQSEVPRITKQNITDQVQTLALPDGSQLVLQPHSEISYPEALAGEKREVQLRGEGFFKVVKNPANPFLVYANGLVTQVVGTSFSVKALDQARQVTVVVRTGKVAVYSLKAWQKAQQNQEKLTRMLLLTPNQQAVYETESERLTKSLIKVPTLLKAPERNQHFVFENTPVADVFRTLEESYGVTITFDAESLKQCSITAPLGDEPLFRKLDIICQTIGATYEVWGTQIIITGKGC